MFSWLFKRKKERTLEDIEQALIDAASGRWQGVVVNDTPVGCVTVELEDGRWINAKCKAGMWRSCNPGMRVFGSTCISGYVMEGRVKECSLNPATV